MRIKLPDTRASQTTRVKTSVGVDAYIIIGFYENNQPGEVFIKVSKMGSFMSVMFDLTAVQASLLLQMGVPFAEVTQKWMNITGDAGEALNALAEAGRAMVSKMGGQIDKGNVI